MGEPRGKSTGSRRVIGRGVIPSDEAIVFDTRPSLWMVFLRSVGSVFIIVAILFVVSQLGTFLGSWVSPTGNPGWMRQSTVLTWGIGVPALLVLVWNLLVYAARRYVLTESRAILVFGVLHQNVSELPLSRVQNVSISKPLALRVLGLGHVGMASAGTDGFEVVWRYVRRPEQIMAKVREHAGQAGPGV
jgi:uncharacterized membrane protein YdbT with pleckstrin-like domain